MANGSGKRGRPQIQRSEALAEIVLAESQAGTPQEEIATLVGMSLGTLRKIYAHELNLGRCQAKSAVRRKIYDLCMAGNVPILIFYAKTQLGWSEKSGKDDSEDTARVLADAVRQAMNSVGNV